MKEEIAIQSNKEDTCQKCAILQSKNDMLVRENINKDKENGDLMSSNKTLKAKYAT